MSNVLVVALVATACLWWVVASARTMEDLIKFDPVFGYLAWFGSVALGFVIALEVAG
jgi:FtsH-binding integral membrane protein